MFKQLKNTQNKKNAIAVIALSFLLVLFLLFCWTYKLNTLPGLHGDEAWSGIKAAGLNMRSIDQLTGMTKYTGILQIVIDKFNFSYLGINVLALRMGGVIFNFLGLITITITLWHYGYKNTAVIFLAILSQSALFLTSPRVAWEVNTFTLFFFSLFFLSLIQIYFNAKHQKSWVFLLLLTNLLGAYNHILFSSITVGFLGGMSLWMAYNNRFPYKRICLLLSISLVNTTLIYFIIQFSLQHTTITIWLPLFSIAILAIETSILDKLTNFYKKKHFRPELAQPFIKAILICSLSAFVFFHGWAFFEILTGYKIFLQYYAYECPLGSLIILMSSAIIFLIYIIIHLWQDLKNPESSLWVFIIITYVGAMNVYTEKTSFRYYLALFVMVGLYAAFKISINLKRSTLLIISLTVTFCMMTFIQIRVYSDVERTMKAIDFKIGNGQIETSAHFLPKEPIIKFLKQNNVHNIYHFNGNPFFLSQPIEFYKIGEPWKDKLSSKAMIGYDYTSSRNSYIYYLIK
jgi:hypothetical protein